MKVVFTICSNNYLARAKVLRASLKNHEPESLFFIFLCDEMLADIDYTLLADNVIPIAAIEAGIYDLAMKYDLVELNTAIKPRAIEYLFNEFPAATILYLDPDIRLYSPLTNIYEEWGDASILLTPHIITPIAIDGKKPGENTFQRYGIFNLGFIGLRKTEESIKFVLWWKDRTYKQGYIDAQEGIFVDQLPINHVPVLFKQVKILYDPGLNMAPWNLHERYLSEEHGKYLVNQTTELKFFHFSGFTMDSNELPVHHYDRFRLRDRPDLQVLYDQYNEELKAAGHLFFDPLKNYYFTLRQAQLRKLKKEKRVKKWLPWHWLFLLSQPFLLILLK